MQLGINKISKGAWIFGGSIMAVVLVVVVLIGESGHNSSSGPRIAFKGETAYVRMPNDNDPKKIIFLAPIKGGEGTIPVPNGTAVEVVDQSFGQSKVMVGLDPDKVGWTYSEWVVNQ